MNVNNNFEDENKAANNILYIFMAISIVPLLMIFGFYLYNPESPLLYSIAARTGDLPSTISSKNPLMSKVMDVYCKSAPFLALIFFVCSFKLRKLNKKLNRVKLIRACLLSLFFYVFCIYIFMLKNIELTTSGRILRFISENNFTLLLFYAGLYIILFFLTYAMCYVPVIGYKLFKERQ